MPDAKTTLFPVAQDLSGLNTLGLASRAGACVTLDQPSQLPALSALARERAAAGAGRRQQCGAAETVPGLVARVRFQGVRLLEARADAWLVEAAGGENWHGFVSACVEQGWDGLENLALIRARWGRRRCRTSAPMASSWTTLSQPDGLGCATGAHGGHVRGGLLFSYRDSRFKHDAPGSWVIVSVRFVLPRPWRPVLAYPDLQRHERLSRTASPTARDIFDAVCEIRRAKLPDPAVTGNAGSFFKNPIVSAAARRTAGALSRPGFLRAARWRLQAGSWLVDRPVRLEGAQPGRGWRATARRWCW